MLSRLLSPHHGLHLVLLMRVMGVVVIARSLKLCLMHISYLDHTTLLFHYWGWGWMPHPPAWSAQALLVMSAIGGAMMLLTRGRASAIGLGFALLGFASVFFMDKAFFGSLNYAILSMLIMLALTRAPHITAHAPDITRIEALAPRTLLALVYFFAGLIKLNGDWLRGDVISLFFEASPPPALLDGLLHAPGALPVLAILGAAFDLCIGPLLLLPRTRRAALIVTVIFHMSNAIMLDVPEVALGMIAMTAAAFASPGITKKLLKFEDMDTNRAHATSPRALPTPLAIALAAALIFHVVFPLRPYAHQDDVRWTHHTQDFSWWLRSTNMSGSAKFFVHLDDRPPIKVDVPSYIDVNNQSMFVFDPFLVTQFAHHIARDYARQHPDVSQVRVFITQDAQLNRRPLQPFIREEIDLAAEPLHYDMSHLVHPLLSP